jgi:DNA-binding response OmpR family regulator
MTTILVAEDDLEVRDLLFYTLKYAGYKVLEASNGEQAMDLIRRQAPDLVLLDVRMPVMTGYAVCAAIKADEGLCQIPVIFLSAKGQEAEIKAGLQSGGVEYLVKPVPPDQLVTAIKNILGDGSKLSQVLRGELPD